MAPKYNLLFISTYQNYFVDHTNFSRMYNNLIYFHKHKSFNVIILQPSSEKFKEKIFLKKNIKVYYFKELRVFKQNLLPFLDLNPFFLLKVIHIVKQHKIDLIHVEFHYGINSLRIFRRIPVSYNAYNVEYTFASQVGKYYQKIPRIFRELYSIYNYLLEKLVLKYAQNINAISHRDKLEFVRIYNTPENKIIVSPFGFRKDVYLNSLKQEEARRNLNIDLKKFIVIFHGSYYSNYANQEAIRLIMNEIAPQVGDSDIMFLIAGRMPNFEDTNNLKFLGYIEDLHNFLYTANIAIVPIKRGSGIKTKIVDYLSAGIPVISTLKGAEGHYIRNEIHGFIIGDDPKEFLEKIVFLKKNPNKIDFFKKNIKMLMIKNYDWDKFLSIVSSRYETLIKNSRLI